MGADRKDVCSKLGYDGTGLGIDLLIPSFRAGMNSIKSTKQELEVVGYKEDEIENIKTTAVEMRGRGKKTSSWSYLLT